MIRSITVAVAVPLTLISFCSAQSLIHPIAQHRSVWASGTCCDQPSQTFTHAESGFDAVYTHDVGCSYFQDNYHYYSANAHQSSVIDADNIRGTLSTSCSARGGGSSGGQSTFDATVGIDVAATYNFSATTSGPWPTTVVLTRIGHGTIFSSTVDSVRHQYTSQGRLPVGDYRLVVTSASSGVQTGGNAGVTFSLNLTPDCACDFNHDRSLNSADLFDYLTAFFTGNADFNHSGLTDSQDFFDFLACFFSACG